MTVSSVAVEVTEGRWWHRRQRRWTLRFTLGAIIALEREHGGRVFAEIAAEAMAEEEEPFLFLALVRAALAVERPGTTAGEALAVIRAVGRPRLDTLLRRALEEDVSGGPKDDSGGAGKEPQPLDYDDLLAAWSEAGQDPAAFGSTTPRAFNAVMRGYTAQQRWWAWHGWQQAALGRIKTMPSLKEHLAPFGGAAATVDRSRGGGALIGRLMELRGQKGLTVKISRVKKKRPAKRDS